jgi:polysaccharide deacetylase 2 family uncharacterized protein YibQ
LARSRKRVSGATLFFFLVSLVLGVLLYRSMTRAPSTERERPAIPLRTPGANAPRSRPRPERTARPALSLPGPTPLRVESQPVFARGELPAVAILIDDLGNDRTAVDRIADWPWAVSAAVLPGLPGSGDSARELARSGKEVLLHLPMEPKGFPGVRPGPGVVLRSQSDAEIATTLESDLDSVPGAVGVNNHMGSAATADPRVMAAIARILSRHHLFFVDSRTTDETVARDAARQARVPSASRRVFLDDVAREDAIEASLNGLIAHAKAEGSAIAIGHPYAATLAVLDRELPGLAARGVRLVRVSELVRE